MSDRSARISLFFSNVGHAYAHIFMLLYPTVVLVLDLEFALSYGGLLSLALPGFVLFGAAALPAGWLGDRWSALGMMAVFFIGTGGASVLTGFAATPWQLGLGLGLIGLFASIYHPVGIAWLVRNAARRGRALGINGMFGGIGIASAASVAGVFTHLIGWRAAFIVPGAVSVATGALFLYLIRTGAVTEATADRKPAPEPARAERTRTFFVLAVTILCGGLIFQALSVALPKVFDERLSVLTQGTIVGVGGMVTLVYLFGGLAQIVGGYMADKYPLKIVYVVAYALMAPVLILAAGAAELPLLLAAMAVIFLNVGALPAENSLLARYTPGRWRSTAFGVKFTVSLGVSSLGLPLVAFIYELGNGFYALFITLGALAAIVLAAAALLPSEVKAEAVAEAPSHRASPAE